MDSPRLRLMHPQRLIDLFEIPEDVTPWEPLSHKSNQPTRERASFGSLSQALTPKATWHQLGMGEHGIYAVGFSEPYPAIYVGLAVGETFLSRLRKHRVKATGSSVGAGVSHTRHWRKFAIDRYRDHSRSRTPDQLVDAVVMLGSIENMPSEMLKDACAWFEARLVREGEPQRALIQCLLGVREAWPLNATKGNRSALETPAALVEFGDHHRIVVRA